MAFIIIHAPLMESQHRGFPAMDDMDLRRKMKKRWRIERILVQIAKYSTKSKTLSDTGWISRKDRRIEGLLPYGISSVKKSGLFGGNIGIILKHARLVVITIGMQLLIDGSIDGLKPILRISLPGVFQLLICFQQFRSLRRSVDLRKKIAHTKMIQGLQIFFWKM